MYISIPMVTRNDTICWLMVFNTTFNNISVISWRSVVLVEKTGVPCKNHRHVASHCFQWGSCYLIFSFMRMFCRSVVVFLFFFFWPLYCLFFFDLQVMVSSNSSHWQTLSHNVVSSTPRHERDSNAHTIMGNSQHIEMVATVHRKEPSTLWMTLRMY